MEKIYDLIIIGAGPAGITASVYAARKRMDFIVVTGDVGGQTVWTGDIENYTGYQFITGPDLAGKFDEHIKQYNIAVKENEEVTGLAKEDKIITVTTPKSVYRAKTVVVASGKKAKELNVPGEQEYKNRGLTYCATCDGPLFAGKDVVIVGGGNSALEAALQLTKIVKSIHMVNITEHLGGDAIVREKVTESDIVTVMNNSQVTEVLGDTFVKGVKIKTGGEEKELKVDGVFVEIGLIPNSKFATELEKNEQGEIKVNCRNETNVPGIFAAGDVTDVPEKQIIIAAGDGAKAVLSAFKYISGIAAKDWG
ncbi:MAG: FAD-dependent oxidoreductase [Candidatus Omnitrophota bacterium]|jgi:alkyl hydroperoxide reductase subunit F